MTHRNCCKLFKPPSIISFSVCCRETLLQALRGVIAGAGQKMGDPIRKTLTSALMDLLGHADVRLFYKPFVPLAVFSSINVC